jgi:protein-disulfide isomerase
MSEHECPTCDEAFGSVNGTRDHAWDAHGVCSLCEAAFEDEIALDTHRLAVHEDEVDRTERKRLQANVAPLSFGDRLSHQGPAAAVSGSISRRAVLGFGGGGLVALFGGAVASGALGGGESNQTLDGHQAAQNLDTQPVVGPEPGEGEGTIIAFEDPSCHSCRRFELQTFPKLKSNLLDTGKVSFVYRGIPVVQPWGGPALLALESLAEQSSDAFWKLKDHYYQNQPQFSTANVRALTQEYLAAETSADAGAVATAMDEGSTENAVRTDQRAARNAHLLSLFGWHVPDECRRAATLRSVRQHARGVSDARAIHAVATDASP